MKPVYLDNNATTMTAPEVVAEMLPYLSEFYGNPSSMHSFGGRVGLRLKQARSDIAGTLGCQPDEIIFHSCGSEGDNTAILSALAAQPDKRHIVTTRVEHPAVLSLARHLEEKGYEVTYLGVDEKGRLDMAELGRRLHALLSAWVEETGYKGKFFIEPGRYVVAECGVLLGTVHATKFNGENRYVGTDLGFNVLVRPAMYDSFHDIEIFRDGGEPDTDLVEQSIVGNICESGDILAKKRMLPLIKEGDIVAALDAGAYGFVMSSSYNQRPRAAEVLITSDGTPKLIRRRETLDDLTRCFVEE